MKDSLKKKMKKLLAPNHYRVIIKTLLWPPFKLVSFGNLRRTAPISSRYGQERGTPIDRYYIEKFLDANKKDIAGHVLEMKDNGYTVCYGNQYVTKSDVLSKEHDNPQATIIADLTDADNIISSDTFDCIICTSTLHYIYDVQSAVNTLYRILKPGGILLATVPVISMVDRSTAPLYGDYWRFTDFAIKELFSRVFKPEKLSIETHGNVLSACSFLHGIAAEELKQKELDEKDIRYQMVITIRAYK
ncbi:MAG: class I SAM-dependent methyltransferase [Candidatus Magnetoovum sp. WYHC-5]|nr:class I SAM-dependent methyltransferase [Candidatus Magnetoovum sp. WYHC-5]